VEYGSCFVPPETRDEIGLPPKYIRDIEEYEKNNADDEKLGRSTEESEEYHDARSDVDDTDNEPKKVIRVPDLATIMRKIRILDLVVVTKVDEDGITRYAPRRLYLRKKIRSLIGSLFSRLKAKFIRSMKKRYARGRRHRKGLF